MNLLRIWSSKIGCFLVLSGVALMVFGVLSGKSSAAENVWLLWLASLLVLLGAGAWWRFDRANLGADPAQLAHVTHLLAARELTQAKTLLNSGGQGAWGDLATVVTNLQEGQLDQEQRAWRDEGLALIHQKVRHDHTPSALSNLVSETLTRFMGLSACAVYVLDFDPTAKRLHAECKLQRQTDDPSQTQFLPEWIGCSYASLQALAASQTILRNGEIPASMLKHMPNSNQGDTVLVPLVIEAQVRGVLLMTSPKTLPAELEALMEPVSAAIVVAMQSAAARETLQASLVRANELTGELQHQQEKLQASEVALKKQMTYVNDILGTMHSGLVVVDQAGRIQDCNPALLKLTGFDRDLLVGQPSSLLFEEDETRMLSIFKGYGHMLSRLGV